MRLITTMLIIGGATLIAPRSAAAQTRAVHRLTLADSESVAQDTRHDLFAGISLSSSQMEEADHVLLRHFVAVYRLGPARSDSARSALTAIFVRRDSLLMALVRNPDDRVTLKKRLDTSWPPSIQPDSQTTTQFRD